MGLESWESTIRSLAAVCSILQMLAPVPICYGFYRKKSVGDMIVTPYVVAMTSCCLWLLYGSLINSRAVIEVNIIGFILQLCYVTCYYFYSIKRIQVQKQLTVSCAVITAALLYNLIEEKESRRVFVLGAAAAIAAIFSFVSPLANIGFIIRVWNSESLPRPLIFANFVASTQWTLYGYIINDKCVQVTNLLGTMLGTIQLLVMIIIPSHSNKKLMTEI